MGRPAGSKNRVKDGVTPPPDSAPRNQREPGGISWPEGKAIQDSLTNTLEGLGYGVKLLNKSDGQDIIDGAAKLSEALVDLARKEPGYRKYLQTASVPGEFSPLIVASGAIIVPIAINHGLFDGLFGKKKEKPIEVSKVAPVETVVFSAEPPVPETVIGAETPVPIFSDPQGINDPLIPLQTTEHILLDDSVTLNAPTSEVHHDQSLYPIGEIHEE